MPKPIKPLRAAEPVSPDAKGQWLVLIGDSGETSADDIEAFFADIWPDVGSLKLPSSDIRPLQAD